MSMFSHVFHLARHDGSYTYYEEQHHLPALYYLDFDFVALLVAAATAATLLVLLLPALRQRLQTLLLGLAMLTTGAAAGYCLLIPEWQVGRMHLGDVAMSYWPGSVRQDCVLGLGIGLRGANVTLTCSATPLLYYNEHLDLEEQAAALRKEMLPPLLLALAPLSGPAGLGARRSGHWASCSLYGAATLWLYATLLVAAAPHRAGDALLGAGTLLQMAAILYHALQDARPTAPHGMRLRYGPCFWVCLGVGLVQSLVGVYLSVMARRERDHCLTTFHVEVYGQQQVYVDLIVGCPEPLMEKELSLYQQGVAHTQV